MECHGEQSCPGSPMFTALPATIATIWVASIKASSIDSAFSILLESSSGSYDCALLSNLRVSWVTGVYAGSS